LNIFDEDEDMSGTSLYYDYSSYMSHLLDLTALLLAPKKEAAAQYGDHSTFGQWCAQIRADAEDRMIMNSKLISMPPLFHYYDVVGEVLVDRHIDMAEFQENLENSLYKWLSENATFKSPIFKSDIVSRILDNEAAKRANIDIKVSELIKGEEHTYRFNPGTVSKSMKILTLPANDINGNDMRSIMMSMVGKDVSMLIHDAESVSQSYRIEDVSVDEDHIYCTLNYEPGDVDHFYVDLTFDSTSFYSKRNLNGIDPNFLRAVQKWIASRTTVIGTDNRPIPLPYTIEFGIDDMPAEVKEKSEELKVMASLYSMLQMGRISAISGATRNSLMSLLSVQLAASQSWRSAIEYYSKQTIRSENMERLGANSVDVSLNLSEESFYFFLYGLVKSGEFSLDEVRRDFPYLYPALKVVFDDNILDDDNNIVNFTSDRDIPVVRLRLRYRYA
jgi:hypothetical protein